jgi:hypothetical protein
MLFGQKRYSCPQLYPKKRKFHEDAPPGMADMKAKAPENIFLTKDSSRL